MTDFIADPSSLFSIHGKVAVITGASGAFGSMAAEVMAAAGARLVLAAGKKDDLDRLAARCQERGAEVETVNRRPATEQDCDAIVAAAVGRFGRADILVVGSGKNDRGKIGEMTLDRFQDVMDANVTQTWLITRSVVQQMIKQGNGGRIILVSSVRGVLGSAAGYSAYCASKAAVDGITRALACELGGNGINVNAIAPMLFRSPLTAWIYEENTELGREVQKGTLMRMPKGRLSEPEDLAGPLLFLASPASEFFTGQVLYPDGGYTVC